MICPKCKAMLANNLISCPRCGMIFQQGYNYNPSNSGTGQLYNPNSFYQQNPEAGQYNNFQQNPGAGQYNNFQQNQYNTQQVQSPSPVLYTQSQTGGKNNATGYWDSNGKWVRYGQNPNVEEPKGKPNNEYGLIAAIISLFLVFVFRWLGGVIALAAFIYCLDGLIRSKKKSVAVLGMIISVIAIGLIWSIDSNHNNDSERSQSNSTSTSKAQNDTDRSKETTETNSVEEDIQEEVVQDNIMVASDYSNMKLGDICNNDGLYVGLSYAKLSDSFTSVLGTEEEISADKQVLFAFFDAYNGGEEKKNIDDSSFSCYVDGINFSKVETNFYYAEDGISNKYSSDLYNNTNKMIITNFEIPREWSEIKLYYGSDCIWILKPEDVSTEPFEMKSMYDVDYMTEATEPGSVIYSDKYEIIYDGYEYVTQDYTEDKFIIIEFTINNTGSEELDYSLVGYNTNIYADNYVMMNADYTYDIKVGDYINVYNLDSVQAGMKAKVYYAFEISGEHEFYRMIYDSGYIVDDYIADIYIKENIASDTDAE